MKNLLLFGLCLWLGSTSCSKEQGAKKPEGNKELPKIEIASLREAPVKMGAAVRVQSLKNDPEYRKLVIDEFSSITAENEMKMSELSIGKDRYNWADADYLVDFAEQNNLRVHGHTLIWYYTTPAWIEAFQGDEQAWKDLMRKYIHDVVGRYKGRVASWDVVNEVMEDNGQMRDCIWKQKLGFQYIELAFQFAREADPDALLFYNEYGQEYSYLKNQKACEFAASLIAKGVPIDGIGLQMHTHSKQTYQNIVYAIRCGAALGLKVHVSELDVGVNPDIDTEVTFTPELAEAQQVVYRHVAQSMLELPEELCYGITTWGVVDSQSWLTPNPDWPLLFDGNYQRKAAYDGLLQGFYK